MSSKTLPTGMRGCRRMPLGAGLKSWVANFDKLVFCVFKSLRACAWKISLHAAVQVVSRGTQSKSLFVSCSTWDSTAQV